MVCGLALLASGQAMAAGGTFYGSNGNITGSNIFTTASNWLDGGCGSSVATAMSLDGTDIFIMCGTDTLTVTAASVANVGTLFFQASAAMTAGSVLKLSSGNKVIATMATNTDIPSLDVSAMTNGNTITIGFAAGTGNITFSAVTGGNLTCGGVPYTGTAHY